jgi:outer membrane protein TolC
MFNFIRLNIRIVSIIWVTVNVIFFRHTILAQSSILTLDDAIARALKNNYGIQIARNDIQVAKNNAVKGNAGFLPNVNLNATALPSVGYLNQKLTNGNEVNRTNLSNNINGGVALNWVLYDGKRMFYTLDRLKELQAIGEVNLKLRTEQLIYDVMRAYYNIVRQQALYDGLNEQIDLYEERFRLAQTRLDVGKGNQLDVFQAQADLNVQKTQLLRQKQAIETAKLALKLLLTEGGTFDFSVRDSFVLKNNFDVSQLNQNAQNLNPQFELLKRQGGVANLVIKETEALKKPRLVLNSAFNIARQDNTAGFFLVNQNAGLNGGVTLSYPIFDGGNIKRQVENAKIDMESNKLRINQLQHDISSNMILAYQNYQNALEILRGEEESMQLAKQSIDIAMERYRLSRSTVLELKQIQQTYEAAIFRAISSRFDAKTAEIDLMRLSGQLVK